MTASRRVLAPVIFAALAIYVLSAIWPLRIALMNNRALWLANQRKWSDAGAQVRKVLRRDPENRRAKFLSAYLDMSLGAYDKAKLMGNTLPQSQERSFVLGVCAYESGAESEALAHFQALSHAKGELWILQDSSLAQLATSELSGTAGGIPLYRRVLSRERSLERMLWESFSGRQLFRAGQFRSSRERLEAALALGDQNPRVRYLACAANAISGAFSRAQMLADYSPAGAFPYGQLAQELDDLYEEVTTLTLSTESAQRIETQRQQLMRASTWSRLREAQETRSSETLARVLTQTELMSSGTCHDLSISFLRAEALETAGKFREAWLQYDSALARSPSYSGWLRLRNLQGQTYSPGWAESEFLRNPPVIACVRAQAMKASHAALKQDYRAFYTQGEASAMIELPADGEYELNLVAKGDRAFGISPRVFVRVDGQMAGEVYVAREGWDCYALRCTLGRGMHNVEIAYANNSDKLLSLEEDRNLYLHSLIVSQTGAYQIAHD